MVKYLATGLLLAIVSVAAIWPFLPTSPELSSSKSKTQTVNAEPVQVALQPAQVVNKQLPDFASYKDVKTKKRKFFNYLKPMVEKVNAEIKQDRAFITQIQRSPVEQANKERFNRLLKKYRVKSNLSFAEKRQTLLRRADVLPIELVLMQAANESAWGTSRFALEANNLFGQWCFRVGCGVVPEGRPEGKKYEVRKFNRPIESIRSYFHNLNTGYAYDDLRTLRVQLRANDKELDPYVIAEGLLPYSTRREEYVIEIQNMIRINKKYI